MTGARGGLVPRLARVGLLLGLLWLGLRWFERVNIYHPGRTMAAVPGTFGLAHEEVALTAEDGTRLHGWFLPAAPFKPAPKARPVSGPLAGQKLAVLLCHGNAGTISDRVLKADKLHRLGLSVLLFDYRGYGQSAGSPSERGTYQDAEAAWSWLAARGFAPERIVLYGESLGNGVAVETALRHPPRALILESAFTSIADMGKEVFPWLPVRLIARTRYDNLAKVASVRAPVLVMHSREDRIVPFRMGRALFDAAPEPKEFFAMTGSHDDGFIDAGPAYPAAIRAFLERR
ncbi:MAG: alpha/beta hydrolase [Elusimicrobia bacterium]|nr:alpha/beta hydrolase [Elusimicrobiota bacterium]